MLVILSVSFLALVLGFVYLLAFPFIVSYRRTLQYGREGCQRPPMYPGDPWGLSLVRQMLRADREQRLPDFMITRLKVMSRKCNRVVSTFEVRDPPGIIAVVTYDPKNIQTVLATKFKDFEIPEIRIKNFLPLLGPGIFSANGSLWEHSRALLRPQFIREQVSEAACEERHISNMLRALPAASGTWTNLTDLQPLFFRLTLDSATEFLFGESVESQIDYLSEGTQVNEHRDFVDAWERGQATLAKGTRLDLFYWLAHNAEFKEMCGRVHKFAEYYVQRALMKAPEEKIMRDEKGENKRYVFLDALAAQTQDPEELRVQLLNILLAGRDTTASMLGWIFRLLALHPAIFNRLRDVVIEQFGTFDSPKEISFATLKSCKYLQQVLNETLRLYPVVPLNLREAVQDTTLPTGGGPNGTAPVFVPKGGLIMYSVHVTHRLHEYWGPTAEDFDPSRWEGRKLGWEYLPFNGGPRVCIGQQFALTKAGFVTVKLLQKFDKIDASALDARVTRHGLALINSPGDGVKVRLRAAK